MAVEIERKFLVTADAWRDAADGSSEHYRQGYLALSERAVVRVRLSATGAAWLCVKERRIGARRGEYEYPIPAVDARELLGLAGERVVEKRRYLVSYAAKRWEVDEFLGANTGLVVAEIELRSETEAFEPPPWLGVEVTGEERYYNAALAFHPLREWLSGPEEE